ncbi:hypothetical protein D047_2709A, partial [Vibrio parahaemolyticus VPTS-2010_2]
MKMNSDNFATSAGCKLNRPSGIQ